jgi:CubicO group peptidase (beta-lactamase class C family)
MRGKPWRKALGVLVISACALFAAIGLLFVIYRPDRAIRVGTAAISQVLCEEVFIAGLDPQRVFDEEVQPRPGLGPLLRHLRYEIDPGQRRVVARWAGHFASVAQYREGYGCRTQDVTASSAATIADTRLAPPAPVAATPDDAAAVEPTDPALKAALDRAFAEPPKPPYRRVRAIVVMRDGQIIAERYAAGIRPDTPLLAYSVSKSVINALIGVLVREGKLRVQDRAPVQAWSDPADPRHAITLDELLRMTSGLRLEEEDSGLDPVSQMLFAHTDDMAAYAEQASLKAPPGTQWEYTSGNTLIAASILRDAVGGHADDVRRFAQDELFGPLGMEHVTLEFDGAGTLVGSTRVLASARDWARFGQLYADDGIVHGKRILPEDWVHYSTTPTLGTDYGSGFWVNAGDAPDARGRVEGGMPADAFYASGLFGQRVVIVPSQHLVIVRFGATMDPPEFDIHGLIHLVSDVIAAEQVKSKPQGHIESALARGLEPRRTYPR